MGGMKKCGAMCERVYENVLGWGEVGRNVGVHNILTQTNLMQKTT